MRGWRGDHQKHADAGKKGGQTTYQIHGSDFYKRIGAMGGLVAPSKFTEGDPKAREAGKKGGQAAALKAALKRSQV